MKKMFKKYLQFFKNKHFDTLMSLKMLKIKEIHYFEFQPR